MKMPPKIFWHLTWHILAANIEQHVAFLSEASHVQGLIPHEHVLFTNKLHNNFTKVQTLVIQMGNINVK